MISTKEYCWIILTFRVKIFCDKSWREVVLNFVVVGEKMKSLLLINVKILLLNYEKSLFITIGPYTISPNDIDLNKINQEKYCLINCKSVKIIWNLIYDPHFLSCKKSHFLSWNLTTIYCICLRNGEWNVDKSKISFLDNNCSYFFLRRV